MKAKITRGGGFRGALNYAFDKTAASKGAKQAEHVGGNMAGSDPRELSAEFAVMRQLRPDIEKPVWHASLSLPEGERLASERWAVVADDFMARMGIDPANNPYVAVRHSDTKYDHIHIIASRIGLDGQVWHGKWEAHRAIEATQELEKKYDLKLTPGLGEAQAERKRSTAHEVGKAERHSELTPRERVQHIIDDIAKDRPSAVELAQRVQAAGVTVRANIASTGRMNGFSFEVDGMAYKGSDLGKAYTWTGLQQRGVTYDASRDGAALAKFKPDNATSPIGGKTVERITSRELRREYAEKWKPAQQLKREEAWESQRGKEVERKTQLKSKFQDRRDHIRYDKKLAPTARKASLSIARMAKVQEDMNLRETISRERAELRANQSHTQYVDFLAEKAQDGDEVALSELRSRTAEPQGAKVERSIDATESLPHAEPTAHLVRSLHYRVARNGNVTYRDEKGRSLIEDAGLRVNIIEKSNKTIELGLRLAVQKFGPKVGLTGPEEFKREVVETAVKAGMKLDFNDENLNRYRDEYTKNLQTGRERVQGERARNNAFSKESQKQRDDERQRPLEGPERERDR